MHNLRGRRFKRLTVLRRAGRDKVGHFRWIVSCSCGSEPFRVLGTNLEEGRTLSCGCYHREAAAKWASEWKTTHGQARHQHKETAAYRSYRSNRWRCAHDIHENGIRFLFDSFEEFYQALGPKPANTILRRLDKNEDFMEGNCEWRPIEKHKEKK